MILVKAGDPVFLSLQLESRLTDKYVRAELRDHLGVEITGSPVSLTHSSDGLYVNSSVNMPSIPFLTAVFKVYNDDQYSEVSDDDFYSQMEFGRDTSEQAQIIDAVKAEMDDSDSFEAYIYDEEYVAQVDDDQFEADIYFPEDYEATIEDEDSFQGEIPW